jgi:elongation factor 1 alpha-like protein
MDSGLSHVRSMLGSEESSGISDKQVKDSLWYYYFDGEKAVAWLLEEKEKAGRKKEKAGESGSSFLSLSLVACVWPWSGLVWSGVVSGRAGVYARRRGRLDLQFPLVIRLLWVTLPFIRALKLILTSLSSLRSADDGSPAPFTLPPRPSRPTPAPLTALQKLSLARQNRGSSPLAQPPSSASAPTDDAASPQPKLSKLAQLAKDRADRAANASPTSSPSPAVSQPASEAPSTPTKPLSKLQQKMLAARQAKAVASPPPAANPSNSPPSSSNTLPTSPKPDLPPEPSAASLFFALPPSLAPSAPSSFASMLALPPSSIEKEAQAMEEKAKRFTALDLIGVGLEEGGEDELRRAFEGMSPDDVVLEKRKGTKLGSTGVAVGAGVGEAKA